MEFPITCRPGVSGKKAEWLAGAAGWIFVGLLGSGWAGAGAVWAAPAGAGSEVPIYVVQLNSFKKKDNVDQFIRFVKTKGYTPFVVSEGEGDPWHKVRVGPYPTRQEAGEVARELQKKHGWPAIVVMISGKKRNRPMPGQAGEFPEKSSFQADRKAEAGDSVDIVMSLFLVWLKSWQEKNANAYFSFYSRDLEDIGQSIKEWRASRIKTFRKSGRIHINVREVQVKKGTDRIEMSFIQEYESDLLSDVGRKILIWKRTGNVWRIVREKWKPIS